MSDAYFDPIAAQHAKNQAMLQGNSTEPTIPLDQPLDGFEEGYGSVSELFMSQTPPTASATVDATLEPECGDDCEEKKAKEALLAMGIDGEQADLLLASAVKKDASAAKAALNIKCPSCGMVQSITHKKCSDCGASIGSNTEKSFKADQGEHAASIFGALELAEDRGDGLVWKAICKTGTLALSPGPNQIDVEKPLELTPDLFSELERSVKEKAFPYITVPSTHGNGLLENTGFVKDVKIEDSKDPADPSGTKVLMAAIDFTEPEIAEKVKRGTIPDTSVGVKFNYRNKRTGKTYPAALEHVALTHQPWVDGLTPFGQQLSQEGVFNQEEADPEYDGVFMAQPAVVEPEAGTTPEPEVPAAEPPAEPVASTPDGDILPDEGASGTILSMADDDKQELTVEAVLASQQAEIERERTKREELEAQLSLAQGTIASTSEQLHATKVGEKVKALQDSGLPPALVTRVESILLADKPGDEPSLNLSIAGAEEGSTQEIGTASQLVDYLLSALPIATNGNVADLVLSLSQEQATGPKTKDATEIADEILTLSRPGGSATPTGKDA